MPFLDWHVIEFARALPADHLIGPLSPGGVPGTKVVVKELASRSFAPAFVHRRTSGFNLPLAQYFRSQIRVKRYRIVSRSNSWVGETDDL